MCMGEIVLGARLIAPLAEWKNIINSEGNLTMGNLIKKCNRAIS